MISFKFNKKDLDCVVGGTSGLDVGSLSVSTVDEAKQFVLAYGYDLDNQEDRDLLWSIQRRAVALIKEQLLDEGEAIPEELYDPLRLTDLTQLLLIAGQKENLTPEESHLQKWACSILRVMHVFVHLRNDLFSAFKDEIQGQILRPIQDAILQDELVGTTVLGPNHGDAGVRLHKFEIKPFKTTASSVVKLLARPDRVALNLLDKLGIRFVTRNMFDSFRVIGFLLENHLISFPHIMPDQSNNTLYPVNLFMEAMAALQSRQEKGEELTSDSIQEFLKKHLEVNMSRAEFLYKGNEFSASDYRFIKFIVRKLVTVSIGEGAQRRAFRFFYPFEIQIMDYETYVNNLSGPMAHDEYKNRQRIRARERVLGSLLMPKENHENQKK